MLEIINQIGAELKAELGLAKFYVSKLPDVTREPVSFAIRIMPSGSPEQYYSGGQNRLKNIQILTQSKNEAQTISLSEKAFKYFFRRDVEVAGLNIITVNTVSEPNFLSETNGAYVYTCAISIEYKEEE